MRSHTAAARKGGMTEAMLGELLAVVGMCNETNALAQAYDVRSPAGPYPFHTRSCYITPRCPFHPFQPRTFTPHSTVPAAA